MKYKYIYFIEVEQKPKTKVYECRNNTTDEVLGIVKWNCGWRQYCFFTIDFKNRLLCYEVVFSASCLNDIADFLNKINKK